MSGADDSVGHVSRRDLLRFSALGSALGVASLAACSRQPPEAIVPYVTMPEQVVPGVPLHFATALELDGYARGVIVETYSGRPTRLEGNPQHPASRGAADRIVQGAVLDLYDDARSGRILENGSTRTWAQFTAALDEAARAAPDGSGLRLLSGPVGSPLHRRLLDDWLAAHPQAAWHQYAPVDRGAEHTGSRAMFRRDVELIPRLDRTRVLLTLDADPLDGAPGHLAHAADFAARRPGRAAPGGRLRLHAAESVPTLTGARADARHALDGAGLEALIEAIAHRLGIGAARPLALPAWAEGLVAELEAHRGEGLVLTGMHLPARCHALALAVNDELGNLHRTLLVTEPVTSRADDATSLEALVADMREGAVDTLIMLDVNPVYDAPADLRFPEALARVPRSIHHGLYRDETARRSRWHVPAAHALEGWGDCRGYDGTVSIRQPVLEPLDNAVGTTTLLASLTGQSGSERDLVARFWEARLGEAQFEERWRDILRSGVLAGSQLPALDLPVHGAPPPPAERHPGPELHLRPDATLWDGRFAANPWLQELPKPLTTLAWDNALLLAPETAEELGVADGDGVTVDAGGRTLTGPVLTQPGQAPGVIAATLGGGRRHAGAAGSDVGYDAYRVRTSAMPWIVGGVAMRPAPAPGRGLCRLQQHAGPGAYLHEQDYLEQLVPLVAPAEQDERGLIAREHELPSLYDGPPSHGPQWGMTIDLDACIGCNACIIACDTENNVPAVGRDEVMQGHDMHWLRVDRYHLPPERARNAPTRFQPVPCMHCEQAPCEYVCPVEASIHDAEGLNLQVYNRCIGTRDCSQNCPYKVRRFNWHGYDRDAAAPPLVRPAAQNPNVTVRSRGVMEKCTYCVQRISTARRRAKQEDRPIADGEVVTACQAACPTEAIVFGDVADPDTRVSALKQSPRSYALLPELGTRPRTTYLARVRSAPVPGPGDGDV